METLPLFHRLQARPVTLIGGGQVATRKAKLLARAGARLTVIAPEITTELQALIGDEGQWLARKYAGTGDLEGAVLIVVATPDSAVNAAISAAAQARLTPVNVVDAPELCSVIFPSLVDRSPLVIGISSNGRSPVLARAVRRRIESAVPAAYGRLAAFAGRMRERIKQGVSTESERRLFWERVIDGPIAELVLNGRDDAAEAALDEALADRDQAVRGEVYLIGAGPGDPDLMTFKALRLLQRADVVLYDRLVNPAIVDLARRDAERIYVGKRRAEHAVPQDQINQQLLDLALEGKVVARLKGGDPFIFGRGGEELELLIQRGISFQVVPGITAASGASCYAGIPLTHRDHAQSVRFVAGYLKGNRVEHDWGEFRNPAETLVFYMGLMALPEICDHLVRSGRDPATPVALVERATLPEQRVLTGTLASMPGIADAAAPQAPHLVDCGGRGAPAGRTWLVWRPRRRLVLALFPRGMRGEAPFAQEQGIDQDIAGLGQQDIVRFHLLHVTSALVLGSVFDDVRILVLQGGEQFLAQRFATLVLDRQGLGFLGFAQRLGGPPRPGAAT